MPNKIILKKSSVASKAPVAGDLDFGELAINYTDSKLYFKKADGSIDAFLSAAAAATVSSVGGYAGDVTATNLLTAIKTVDGAGSGLDADTLDGLSSASFYLASNPNGYTSNLGTVTNVGATSPVVSSGGTTPTISIPAATTSVNGYMTAAYASKLDGIAAGAQVNVATNLTYTTAATTGTVNSSTGTNATVPAATTALAGLMVAADKTKLDGIAAGATNVTNTNQLTNGAGYITSTASITGNAATATTLQTTRTIGDVSFNGSASIVPERITLKDTRNTDFNPNSYSGVTFHIKQNTTDGLADGGTYHGILNLQHWGDLSGGNNHQLGFTDNNNVYIRQSASTTTWGSWVKLYDTDDAATANTVSKLVLRDASGNFSAGTITAALSGNASTATTLQTGRTIAMTGDVTYTSGSFNGSTNVTGTATLANSGVTAGTYTKITVDAKGRATSGTSLSASDIPALDASKITSGTIDAARLPSYVDDVIEAINIASFPVTGETGKIYVTLDTNKTYRWSGSAYVYITSGAVDSVAGKTGVVTLVKGDVGLGSVDNTADSAKNVLSATKLTTARTISLTGDVTGSISFDGSANASITATVADDSHNHIISNVDGLQTALDAKAPLTGTGASGTWGISITGSASTATTATNVNGGTARISSLRGTDQMIENAYGAYQHIGGWAVGRTDTTAVLVNTAYMADILSTARTINDVSFNGSTNITVYDSTKLPLTGGTITGNLTLTGTLSAASKSFLIPHPTKEGKQLRYGSLEGPEHGVYVRGKINGNVIELPEYWTKLVDPESITVQLTSIGKNQKLFVKEIKDNKIFIANEGKQAIKPNCFYLVQAERVDVDKIELEVG